MVFLVGIMVVPGDSLNWAKNEYLIKVTTPSEGYLEIFFKDRLLYKYYLINNEVQGTGIIYYPFLGNVAIEGQFNSGVLDGLVFVHKKDGEMIEVMKFRKGKYIRHLYHWLSFSKKSLKARSRNRSSNPLRNDEVIEV